MAILRGLSLSAMVLLLAGGVLCAQTPLSPRDDAARAQERQRALPKPQDFRASVPAMPRAAPLQATAPEGADTVTFTLQTLTLEGRTAFPLSAVQPLYAPLLGKTVSLTDIYTLAARLTEYYQSQGYSLAMVVVPPQEIEDGAVRLRAVEGYIAAVRYPAFLSRIPYRSTVLQRLMRQRPLRGDALEETLLRLNQLPGVQVSGVLQPIRGRTGAFRLLLQQHKEEPRASLQGDNHGSQAVGPWQTTAFADVPVTWPLAGRAGGNCLVTSPLRELQSCSLQWTTGLLADGTTLTLGGSHAASHPDDILGDSDIQSLSSSLNLSVERPLLFRRHAQWSASAGFSARDSETLLGDIRLYHDKIRTLRAGLNGRFSDSAGGSYMVGLEGYQAVPWFQASDPSKEFVSRGNASRYFHKVTLRLARYQPIGQQNGLLLGLEGQYSPDVLFSAEQFGYGGAAIGRAFNNSEITGDQGVSAYAEFSRTLSPPLESLQWFAFVDGGRVWENDPSVTDDHGGSSYGAGIRWNTRYLASSLTIAQPLSLTPSIPVGGQDNGSRVLMMVQMRY